MDNPLAKIRPPETASGLGKSKRNNDFDLLIEEPRVNVKVFVCASEETWMLETKDVGDVCSGRSRSDLPGKHVQ